MNRVSSKDGTSIDYDDVGQGPALVIVTGAIAKKSDAASVAGSLSPFFTVFTYDRRGRGNSSDTAPYAIEREIEDLQAILNQAGGSAFVFGHSSGAVLALLAARQLPASIKKLAVYEPPILVDNSRPPFPPEFIPHLKELAAAGRRGETVAYYMTKGLLVSDEELAAMQKAPVWLDFEAVAPTLVYDSLIVADTMSGQPLARAKWGSITIPTLVMDGGKSYAFMHSGAEALAAILPNAQRRHFPDQDHGAADEVLVPALLEFFKS